MSLRILTCPGCGLSPENWASFPLCPACDPLPLSHPLTLPPGSDDIQSAHASHLLLGRTFRLIKGWKRKGGVLLTRRVLRLSPEVRNRLLDLRCEAIVPVPQSQKRAWRLRGSPALRIGRWLAGELGTVLRPEVLSLFGSKIRRQAELNREERIGRRIAFRLTAGTIPRSVLLVDDVWTSGATIRSAARALRVGGASEVHAFCLGFRPLLSQEPQRPADLAQGQGGAVAIAQERDAAVFPHEREIVRIALGEEN
jgi:predicted amidophosphoribosyltransferase